MLTSSRYRQYNRYYLLSVILLCIAASRIFRLLSPGIIDDEVWSVWQTLGSPLQIIHWTPYDWPPLFYLLMGVWRGFVGMLPVADRFLSALLFLLACVGVYRLVRRLSTETAALLSVLAFAAFGYSIHITTTQRGYVAMLALLPFALWFTLRYFDHSSLKRAILLAVSASAIVYIHYTAVFALLALGLFSLVMYPRKIWRWWLPGGLIVLLVSPLLLQKVALARSFANATQPIAQNLPPLPEALASIFADLTGSGVLLWGGLLVISALFLFYWQRRNRLTFALLVWLSLMIVLYFARSIIGSFFSARFVWWELMPFAIWIGWGLSHITRFKGRFPHIIVTGSAVLMLAASALPVPTLIPDNTRTPLMDAYSFLKTHMQRYDVILVDPNCNCVSPMEWDYYTQAYFPEGMQFITDPSGYRRIWYVTGSSSPAPDIEATVTTTRLLRESIGPLKLRFRLYEAPPNPEGILFDNGMRFHGAEFISPDPGMMVLREGESFRVRLWWTVDRPIGAQFSIGLYVMNKGRVAAQSDGPQESDTVPKYTDQWKPGTSNFYVEERDMQIPYTFATGTYPLYITVYQSWDGTRLSAPGVDANKLLLVEQLNIKSWSIVY